MMRFLPTFSKQYNLEEVNFFFEDLGGFKGPGLYENPHKTKFVLIIPVPPEDDITTDTVWHVNQPPGTVFDAHFFDYSLSQSLLGSIYRAPLRT